MQLAYNKADYTSIKSILQAFLKVAFGKNVVTTPNSYAVEYTVGRSASIIVEGNEVGNIGEISDSVRYSHRIRVSLWHSLKSIFFLFSIPFRRLM